jgi:biopolymer transport protein TolR
MISRGRTANIIREINIIPLLDLVLTVLFFYMVVSPMMTRGLDVNLPISESNTVKPQGKPLEVTVTKGREIYLDQDVVKIDKLRNVLELRRKNDPKINVYLRADRDVPYGTVVRVVDIIKQAGIDRLGMVTEGGPSGQ